MGWATLSGPVAVDEKRLESAARNSAGRSLHRVTYQHDATKYIIFNGNQRRSSRPPNPPIGGGAGQLWGPKLV